MARYGLEHADDRAAFVLMEPSPRRTSTLCDRKEVRKCKGAKRRPLPGGGDVEMA